MSLAYDGFGYIADSDKNFRPEKFKEENKKKEYKPRGHYIKRDPMALTKKQINFLVMLEEYLKESSYYYLRDIAQDLGIQYNYIYRLLKLLDKKGFIKKDGRHIEILKGV
jgi:DNA-binding MarR family transcriptional regulator